MRRLLIMATMLPLVSMAQVFSSVSIEKLQGSVPGDVRMAGISKDGRYAFTTSMSNKGLQRVSLDGSGIETITTLDGAGYKPVISPDGKTVVHCADMFDEHHLRHTSVHLSLPDGSAKELQAPVRNLRAFSLLADEAMVATTDGTARHKIKSIGREALSHAVSVTTSDLRIQLTRNGETQTLTPNGDDEDTNYIWASLSPSGDRILYYVSDEGAYVCNLEGEDVQFIASDCLAPQWYDDQTIVGMDTTDDGKLITSSTIVAYGLDGSRQQLTEPSSMLMYPFCSAKAGSIVCTAANGEMYVLKVLKTEE